MYMYTQFILKEYLINPHDYSGDSHFIIMITL